MSPADILALAGPFIAIVVSLAKRVPFVANNPKWIAGALSLVVATLVTFLGGNATAGVAATIIQLIVSALTGTASAVASYEVATNR